MKRILFGCLLLLSAFTGAEAQQKLAPVGKPLEVRCVNVAGDDFESCGGTGGSGGIAQDDNTALGQINPIGALYDTTPPAIADGSVGIPLMDSSRRLRIVCEAGTCGGASPFADEDAFTIGTTSISIGAYIVDETLPDSAPEDSAAAPRMAPNRIPYSILRDGAGNERGANVTAANALKVDGSAVTQPVSGTVTATGPLTDAELRATPVPVSGTVTANAGSGTFTVSGTTFDGIIKDGTGDTTQANVSSGRLHVDGSGVTQPVSGTVTVTDGAGALTVDGTVTANQGGAPWSVAGPAADGAAVAGNPVRISGKDGSGNTQDIATDTSGELQVDVLTLPNVTIGTLPNEGQQTMANSISVAIASDQSAVQIKGQNSAVPIYCNGQAKFLNMTTATTTEIVALSGSTHIYVCSYAIITTGTTNVKLVSGTGSNCATSQADVTMNAHLVANSGTAGINRTAGGGNTVARTNDAGDALCVTSSAAVNVDIEVSYVQF